MTIDNTIIKQLIISHGRGMINQSYNVIRLGFNDTRKRWPKFFNLYAFYVKRIYVMIQTVIIRN